MDEDQRQHLESLRQTHLRRLRILEQQAALSGINARPEVLIEIDDTRAAIGGIERQLSPPTAPAALQPAPPAVPKEQRKQATILFADVSGFTALSETLDPEDVADLMNALWRRLDSAITGHGGMIDKHIGDAVMAIWSAQATREDDPEQAIRAALMMLEALAHFRAERQIDLAMRIGINTGPVLLGAVGSTNEFTAMGDAVNVASRLEHAAPIGGILISHETYRHVRGLFAVQPLDPIAAKGKAEPLRAYAVTGGRSHGFRDQTRGIEGVETRMVGRESELKNLQEAFAAVVEDAQQQVLTIVAEPGLGKSRLLYEFDSWLAQQPEQFFLFKGRAVPSTQRQPYALLRDLFAFRCQIQDSDPAEVVRAKLERDAGAAFGASAQTTAKAHLLGHLMGFAIGDSPHLRAIANDAQQARDRAVGYLQEYILALTEQHPLVLLLEDLHWADDSTLDVLARLDTSMDDRPILIVGAARPALLERRPRWGEGQTYHTTVRLQPLGTRDSRRMVVEILKRVENVPIDLRDMIVASADGNPFYVEELIKMLIDDGVIHTAAERWRIDEARLGKVRVPSTLIGVLQARFDSLSPIEQEVLQRAAVLGRIFWDDSVAYLGGADGGALAALEDVLGALRARELVFQRELSTFGDAHEYMFKHALLRDATYERALKRDRRVYHERAALWLADVTGRSGRADEYAGLIAGHYEHAQITAQASAWYQRAGRHAAARFANAEAIAHISRALDMTPATQAGERYTLLLEREQLENLLGDRAAQARDLALLETLAAQLGDGQRAEVALRQANYAEVTGDYGAALAAARQAVALAQRAGAPESEASGYFRWGRALFQQSDYPAARAALDQALAAARSHGLAGVEAHTLRNLGLIALNQGNHSEARGFAEQAIELFRQVADRRGERAALANLGTIAYFQADYPTAQIWLEQALNISQAIGDRQGESDTRANIGAVALDSGDHAKAQAQYEQALRLCRAIGNRWGEIDALSGLGKIAAYHGDYTVAIGHQEQARQACLAIGDRVGEGIALINLGEVATRVGHHDQARGVLEQALEIIRQAGDRRNESWALVNLGQLFHQSGDAAAAQQAGEQALGIAREIEERAAQAAALTVLGHALLDLGRADAAIEAYGQAVSLQRALGEQNGAADTLAGLSRALLAQGRAAEAQAYVEALLSDQERRGGFNQGVDSIGIQLACYQVLRATRDPRAQTIARAARALLDDRAAKLPDETMRQAFLENIPAHRELRALSNETDAQT